MELREVINKLKKHKGEIDKLLDIANNYVKMYYDLLDFETLCFNPHLDYDKVIHNTREMLEKLIDRLEDLDELLRKVC